MKKTKRKTPIIGRFSDPGEKALIEAFEADGAEFKSLLTPARRRELVATARATMNGTREKITLRIPRTDLSRLKSKALQEGMPYQTLINSILHKAVS